MTFQSSINSYPWLVPMALTSPLKFLPQDLKLCCVWLSEELIHKRKLFEKASSYLWADPADVLFKLKKEIHSKKLKGFKSRNSITLPKFPVCVCVNVHLHVCTWGYACVRVHACVWNFHGGKAAIKRGVSVFMQVMEWKISSYCSSCQITWNGSEEIQSVLSKHSCFFMFCTFLGVFREARL